jgi:hypothetical protein
MRIVDFTFSSIHNVRPQNVLNTVRDGLSVVPQGVLEDDPRAGLRRHRSNHSFIPPVLVEARMPSLKFAVIVEIQHQGEETPGTVGTAERPVSMPHELLSVFVPATPEARIETDQVPALVVDGEPLGQCVTTPLKEPIGQYLVVDDDPVVVPIRWWIVSGHGQVTTGLGSLDKLSALRS